MALAVPVGCKPKEKPAPSQKSPAIAANSAPVKGVQVSPPAPTEEEVLPDPPVGEEEPMPAAEPARPETKAPSEADPSAKPPATAPAAPHADHAAPKTGKKTRK